MLKMSLLKTFLACLVSAVVAVGPPILPLTRPVWGGKGELSNNVHEDGIRLMQEQMKELTPRVARMEGTDDQQRQSFDNLKLAIAANMDSLQTMSTNISHRMDALEAMFASATSTNEENKSDHKENTKDHKQIMNFAEMTTDEQIKACGQPPLKLGMTVKVKVNRMGKVKAKYSCDEQYVLIKPDGKKSSRCIDGVWSPVSAFCSNLTTCGHKTSYRMEYNGTLNVTKSGKTCQQWSSFSPHRHHYVHPRQFLYTTGFPGGESLTLASNYCRDPGLVSTVRQAWCFTTDPDTRWEKCDIPVCGKGE